MIIHQFYDKGLAHGSYAIIRDNKMIVIDPARDPKPYYNFAAVNEATIVGVIETHPHADFVSSHLEIHETTGAVIYASKLLGAEYPHESFDEGETIKLGDVKLKAINTPGHSPDSICILAIDEHDNEKAIFTGDTLFVGDVGRPDLRENVGNLQAKKEELALQMYNSTREKLMTLPHYLTVYPAHGPGSLCGKNLSPDLQSTIGRELRENYALQLMDEFTFIKTLIDDQPFIPKYFGHDVNLNKKGAPKFEASIALVKRLDKDAILDKNILVIDSRPEEQFKQGHISGAFNLQNGEKFETWLGSIISPDEKFYLISENSEEQEELIKKSAKIGYEGNIEASVLSPDKMEEKSAVLSLVDFKLNESKYTIIDIRNTGETENGLIFKTAITIPLPELRERIAEIPTNKPILVHCAAGYRSALGSSIIAAKVKVVPVYDLSDAVKDFIP